MKTLRFVAVTIAALMAVAAVQSQAIRMRATIPFNFQVNGTTLPAGNYDLTRVDPIGSALQMASYDAKASVMFVSNVETSNRPSTKSKLVFHRYGNDYFLSEIWTAGDNRARKLSRSPEEAHWAMTQPQEKSEVTLYADLR